jgi:hypothetical protein
VNAVLDDLCVADGHEAHANRRVLVRANDDLALARGQDLPAKRLSPESRQPRQIMSVDHDVVQSYRHPASMAVV